MLIIVLTHWGFCLPLLAAPTKLYHEDHVFDTILYQKFTHKKEDTGRIQRTPLISIFILLIIFISLFIYGHNVLFENKCSGGKFMHKTWSGHSPVLRYAASIILKFSFV